MWRIKQIAEADFGCEERLPGEKLKCLVILENEKGETRRLEVEDEWAYRRHSFPYGGGGIRRNSGLH